MSEVIVRTVYGANLQTCQLMGIPFTLTPNSTLNEKFGIAQTNVPNATDMPRMKYVCIGNAGHRMKTTGNSTLQVPEPQQHQPTDAALFSHLPFVLRQTSNDLTVSERARYALRKLETYAGVNYFAYYLRRMDLTAVTSQMEYKAVTNTGVSTTAFQPDSDNLNPVAPVINTGNAVTTSGDYVTASARVSFVLDTFDVTEIRHAASVIYGSDDYAIISEIGLASGIDKTVTAFDVAGGSFNFNEVIAAQIVNFITSFHALKFTSNGVNTLFDVGATEPLFLPSP